MLRLGSNVVEQLLRGLMALEKQRLVLKSIQPSTITINYDGSELCFSDIRYHCKSGDRLTGEEEM